MSTAPVLAPAAPARRQARSGDVVVPAAVGVGAAVLGAAGSWVPSVWADEAATLSAATRSWLELGRLVENIDAVHAAYYAIVHVWLDLLGPSALTLRLLSALAVGVGAAGVVVLGRMLAGPAAGLAAGVVFAVLPRVTWMATEGRSPALVTAVAVWLTVLFVVAVRRSRARWWVAYALVGGVVINLWMFAAFLVGAHGVSLLWARGSRRQIAAFGAAAAVAATLATPMVLRAAGQSGQVSWIPPVGVRTLRSVAVDQWFGTDGLLSLPLALVSWLLVVLAVGRALRPEGADPARSVVVLALPWLALPTAGVVAYSLAVAPMYTGKYLALSLPALSLLVGVAVAALRPTSRRVVALGCLTLLAVPSYLSERTVTAKDASDWRLAAERVAQVADPGDAVVFTDVLDDGGRVRFPGRVIAAAYPREFALLADPTREATALADGALWDGTLPPAAVADELSAASRVLLVADVRLAEDGRVRQELESLGLEVVDAWEGTQTAVLVLEQGGR